MTNKANVVGVKVPQITVDGACLKATLDNLKEGGAAKPMPEDALVKVRADAIGLLEKVVTVYTGEVAPGEVGASASHRASPKPPSKRAPTGLLYGRVQSGKTVAMITFAAAAIDNGFKVIVVLTSDNVKLVSQTAERFAALDGALIRNSNNAEQWEGDAEHIKDHIAQCGVVFICTKNQQRLTALVDFLASVGAGDYPALVLDDEADQATLDTTVAARKAGRKPQTERSVIHEITVNSATGHSIRQTLRHHVFVQVTATPYALLLQNVDTELRPSFTHLIEPGVGYTGGEAFFDARFVEQGVPPLFFVPEEESSQFEKQKLDHPPVGLQNAIAFFLVASGAQAILDAAAKASSQNFLCHTSQKTSEHLKLADLIRSHLTKISAELKAGGHSETMMRLQAGYDELAKTLPNRPPLEAIIERIKARLPRREVPVVNSMNGGVEFGRELNFIVGGNILGRGLTIENLLVTYYLRRARISQMDTVLQHARMYGYRKSLMPYTRVFLPEDLAARFHFIHTAETNLRRQLSQEGALSRITVETMASLRATRLNVLDTSNLAAYEPGQHIYPGAPALDPKSLARTKDIEKALKEELGDDLQSGKFEPVEPDVFIRLLHLMPYPEEYAENWDPVMFEKVLNRVRNHWKKGYIFYRTMNRGKRSKVFATGAFAGDELALARSQPGPVLACFRDDGTHLAGGRQFFYPSFVFPSKMPTQVYNLSSE